MLETYAARYRAELAERVIPFWLRHALDHEHGGYFSALDRDGTVYDTRKYVWLQGRAVWMFSRLYNEFTP
ncbi:AGE family epimerase/isomerase, partial [Chloroflexus sp.]|uniref:AGE family epimerase/isomerase n=1 Tax=Chloroflexus sp. TaxID=1904827 RepID=UPI002ACD84FD